MENLKLKWSCRWLRIRGLMIVMVGVLIQMKQHMKVTVNMINDMAMVN